MVLRSVSMECGDTLCNGAETYLSCPIDCNPQIIDYINCAIEKGTCTIGWFDSYGSKIIFLIFIFIVIYFLKTRKKI